MEVVNFTPEKPEPPKVFPIDTSKIKDLEDVKTLLSVMGIAMTVQFAEEHNLSHLIDPNNGE